MPPPDLLIDADTSLILGGMEVQILSVAPAHSNSDLLLWLPQEKVVFCGDVVFESGGCAAYSAEGMRLWIKALDFIQENLKIERVVPGHGGVCSLEDVRLNRLYFQELLEQFEMLYTDDINVMDLAKAIDIERYKNWLQPERLFINANALVNDRRGLPNLPDWDFFTSQLPVLKKFHDQKYGVRPWNPLSSWKE